jgi:hypothetical protein
MFDAARYRAVTEPMPPSHLTFTEAKSVLPRAYDIAMSGGSLVFTSSYLDDPFVTLLLDNVPDDRMTS